MPYNFRYDKLKKRHVDKKYFRFICSKANELVLLNCRLMLKKIYLFPK